MTEKERGGRGRGGGGKRQRGGAGQMGKWRGEGSVSKLAFYAQSTGGHR